MLIVAEQRPPNQKKDKERPPIYIKWAHNTREIRYVDIIDESFLSIGFETCSINLPLGDPFIAEKIKSKVEKVMKSIGN